MKTDNYNQVQELDDALVNWRPISSLLISSLKSSWRIEKYNHWFRTVCKKRNFERKKNRITERERREREERSEKRFSIFFLTTRNWDYIHIYSAIA